ncbi:unnamed protein product [Commensalibacter communis]|uniref:hypothetical protein n=1 Tax=Commensalibacter communis TaxID=2972786 RepID=UPI0022FF6F78|nr:hypothetical protein [Commensalibacter communis]CAI3959626.1 unnamed protein product [Commensalibacter communis]CAI3960072.1 unnamed protein product [Commensalibacter communis]
MAETISQSEAARRVGVSQINIQKQLKVGWIQSAELSQTWIIPHNPSLPIFKNLQDAELSNASYEARLKQLDCDFNWVLWSGLKMWSMTSLHN